LGLILLVNWTLLRSSAESGRRYLLIYKKNMKGTVLQ